jgi:HK97 family phage portal protein
MTALQISTVFACVNLISDGISSLPLHVYLRMVSEHRIGKKVAFDHNLWNILHNEPNEEMTTPVWLKTCVIHALLWGNSYNEIERDGSNQIINIWPRNPARTRPIRLLRALTIQGTTYPPGTLVYETTDPVKDGSYSINDDVSPDTGIRRLILAEDMLHVPGLSLDGRIGQSVAWTCRQVFGLALASEKYAAKFFGNGARPAGVLSIPGTLDKPAEENLRRSWAEAHGGENQFKVAILEQGLKFEKIAATPEEGQMLQTRNFQRGEICAVFGVPLHMVAASEKAGKSNVEQSSIEFVLYCLHPWLVRFEKEFSRKLFPKLGRTANMYFPHFDTRRLLYPDAAARGQFYAAGRQWGFLNGDDIRELEDFNPIPDGSGERYWMPINMQYADDPQKLGAEDQADLETKNQLKIQKAQHDQTMEAAQQQHDNAQAASKQAHKQSIEANDQANTHAQKMAKLGVKPEGGGGGSVQPGKGNRNAQLEAARDIARRILEERKDTTTELDDLAWVIFDTL